MRLVFKMLHYELEQSLWRTLCLAEPSQALSPAAPFNDHFGQNGLWYSSDSAPCSCFSLSTDCFTSLPGSLSSLTLWATLETGVIIAARVNLTLCAVVRTKSPSAAASAVHLQAFNLKYFEEAEDIPFLPPPCHAVVAGADCGSPQSRWFPWPVDEEIAGQLFRCCWC